MVDLERGQYVVKYEPPDMTIALSDGTLKRFYHVETVVKKLEKLRFPGLFDNEKTYEYRDGYNTAIVGVYDAIRELIKELRSE